MSHLVLCQACWRHIRAVDETCPFCNVALAAEQRESAPPELPRRRLGRAALFTFGATLIGGAACSDGTTGNKDAEADKPVVDGGGGNTGTGDAAGSGTGGSSGTGGAGTGGFAPPYGIGPLYGAPPATDE